MSAARLNQIRQGCIAHVCGAAAGDVRDRARRLDRARRIMRKAQWLRTRTRLFAAAS